jgi:hypothetical protein
MPSTRSGTGRVTLRLSARNMMNHECRNLAFMHACWWRQNNGVLSSMARVPPVFSTWCNVEKREPYSKTLIVHIDLAHHVCCHCQQTLLACPLCLQMYDTKLLSSHQANTWRRHDIETATGRRSFFAAQGRIGSRQR